jgi:hypothetical protein
MWQNGRPRMVVRRIGTLAVATGLLLGLLFSESEAATTGPSGTQTSPVHKVTDQSAATLTGPMTTGHVVEPLTALPLDLASHGYVEREYFASGTATAFKAKSMPSNGKWSITPTTSASYRTRILVRRPANPARFNGTVIVEWMNVSGGESAPDWDYLNPMLMRDGYAYVAVSAQS